MVAGVAVATALTVSVAGCGSKPAPSTSSTSKSGSSSPAPTSSASAQPTDYTGLLIKATDIYAPIQFTAMPFVKAPTAKHSLGNGKWEGGLLIPIGYAVPKSPLSIGLTPEIDWAADADGHGHHAAMVQVVSLGWAVSDKLGISGDVWGQWDWDPSGTGKQVSADGSVAYLVSNSVQLDAGANFGLNKQTPDVELYAGISKRF